MTARHHRGFTLLEVLTTLVLLGILAGGVVSVLPDSSNVNLGAEADLLKSHLRYAQIRAQGDTHEWRLAFNDSSNYQLGPVRVTGQGFVPDVVPGTEGNEGTLTDGVTASEALIIRFDSWGSPLNDDGTPLSADRTITLTAGTQTETITILAETGLIR